jgi:WD40 repeat protein
MIYSVIFSPDGSNVLTGSADNTAILWDAATDDQLRTFSGHTDYVLSIAFSPGVKYVLTGSADWTVKLWDVDYQADIRWLCGHLKRDLNSNERGQYDITDDTPTCP